jgi:hypothetical protein
MQPDPVAKAVGGGVITPGLRKNRPKWADFLPKRRKIASKSIRAAGLGENSALRRDYFRGLLGCQLELRCGFDCKGLLFGPDLIGRLVPVALPGHRNWLDQDGYS